MKKLLLSIVAGALVSPACLAAQSTESDLLESLQQDMQHFSDIAIDTRQNVDYMPYVISTLHNNDLVELGVQNLREALILVPGVDLTVGMAGVKNPIFRGSNPYAFGQSRLIIDGMVVNDQIFGGYNQFLEMPIDIIHRIEVVRGPGSMLQHVNGFAGSIHVITSANRDDGVIAADQGFIIGGSDDHVGAGVIKSVELGKGQLSTDIYYHKHDLQLPVGTDRYGNEGDTDQSLKNYQIGLNYNQGGFSARARISDNESGVSYGQAFSLTDDSSDFLDVANNTLELKYETRFNSMFGLELALNYFDEHRELQNKVIPDGAMVMMPAPMMLPDGRYFLVDYKEQRISQRIQLNIDFSNTHRLILGVETSQAEIKENQGAISNNDLATIIPFELFSTDSRDVNTFYIEDQYDFNEQTSVQVGAKLSNYDDVDNQSAIRMAVVHRLDDENIFKAMFSQSYREPSWREQYLNAQAYFRPNLDLEAEQVDALELAYIHRTGHRDFFKINAFLLKNSDQIDAQNTTQTFTNSEENELTGFELEYETGLFSNDILGVNYSFISGDNVTDALANSAKSLARIYYLYRYNEDWGFSGVFKYVGDKGRTSLDSRDDVDAYSVLDITTNYSGFGDNSKLSISIKNLLDEKYYFPSPNGTYSGDFEQPGVTIFLRMSKEF